MDEELIKKEILEHLIEEFGHKEDRKNHYSYCMAPFEACTCNELKDANYDTSLIAGGYIDSFSLVSVLVWLEKKYRVEVPGKYAIPDNMDTVNKMFDLIIKFKI